MCLSVCVCYEIEREREYVCLCECVCVLSYLSFKLKKVDGNSGQSFKTHHNRFCGNFYVKKILKLKVQTN